jgi:hypothetical protein
LSITTISTNAAPLGTIRAMSEIGVVVQVRDEEANDLGRCLAPPPVEPGDVIVLEHGPPLRVVAVISTPAGSAVVPVTARDPS